MSITIEDGRGSGVLAGISSDKELLVYARSIGHLGHASVIKGVAYYVTTGGFIPLTTTTSFSGIFYLKNTGSLPIYLWSLRTCGTAVQRWNFIQNPTAGTLISAGTDIPSRNINFSSPETLVGTVKAGSDAKTVTDGNMLAQWINPVGHAEVLFDGTVVVTTGKSIALTCKPLAAADVCVTILVTQENINTL